MVKVKADASVDPFTPYIESECFRASLRLDEPCRPPARLSLKSNDFRVEMAPDPVDDCLFLSLGFHLFPPVPRSGPVARALSQARWAKEAFFRLVGRVHPLRPPVPPIGDCRIFDTSQTMAIHFMKTSRV